MPIYYELCETTDPEERLEDAAMFKALHDAWCGDITPTMQRAPEGAEVYGRGRRFEAAPELTYWTDPAFLSNALRSFQVTDVENLPERISDLHAAGKGAFLKSTRAKHYIGLVPVAEDWREVMDSMVYSFIDGGPQIMVQEAVHMEFEWRFFVIGRKSVAHSPNAAHLSPLDYPCNVAFPTPSSRVSRAPTMLSPHRLRDLFFVLADRIARTMRTEDAVIDVALINGQPGVVELNPMSIGGVGLFAADVRAIAAAVKACHPRLAR